jgi:putative ABC transport system ATP-binding protein
MILKTEAIKLQRLGGTPLEFPDIAVEQGGALLLLGPSGCGKTSLLFLLSGLLKPSSGSVIFDGRTFEGISNSQMDALRAQNFGFIFQAVHLIGHLTVAQNIALSYSASGKVADFAKIEAMIAAVGLEGCSARLTRELSHGQAQRVEIARALVHGPRVIFADEPTSALDDQNAARVMDLLFTQAKACGAALVVCTHDARIKSRFTRHLELK